MTAKETVEAAEKAAAALEGAKFPHVAVHAPDMEAVRQVAQLRGVAVDRTEYAGDADGRPWVLEVARWRVGGCMVSVMAGEPVRPGPALPTCSECKGPLSDGMGCTARDGRCGSCLYEEGERERKAGPYRGTVCAEERAIDAGIRGGA